MTTRRLRLPKLGWVTLDLAAARERAAPRALTDVPEALTGVIASDEAKALDPGALHLVDVNVVRATLTQLGVWPEDDADVVCDSCDAAFTIAPCKTLELGAYFDGDADDPQLDAGFDFERPWEIPPVTVRGHAVESLVLRDVTLAEAAPLHRACASYHLRLTRDVVRAMGIVALGDERDAGRIARALQQASDGALDVVFDLFDEAHYPPRLLAAARCPKCGASNTVEAPSMRELPSQGAERAGRDEPIPGFPDLPAFETMVEREAEALYARLGVSEVALIVESGVPDVDDGGVTLLGSYTPPEGGDAGFVAHGPEVRVYYRTFRAMFEDEPYDVRGEIEETIEHELRHHLAFLAGDDPEDEAERAEIAREARRAVGDTETLRRGARAARSELWDFCVRTWPIWLVVLLATIAATLANR